MSEQLFDRGMQGVLPRTNRLADESYLDFVETFRGIKGYGAFPIVAQNAEIAVAAELGETDDKTDLDEIKSVINRLPIAATWQRFMRSHQEMMWRRVRASYEPNMDAILAAIDEVADKGPGKLVIDPNFVVPEYAREEIHLQPGGYTEDPLGGLVYHYGTKVFYAGTNDQDELHQELADTTEPPKDGKVERILDLACSIGQATITLKDRWPDAEVWGLDVAEPLVKYAHWRAVERGVDVNFIQGLSEDTGFDDNHFDIVHAYILFHEIPVEIIEATVNEMFRILRPGGNFCIFEFPSAGPNMRASQRWMIDYDSINNCEPYSPGFVYADFHGMLKAAGFEINEGPKNSNGFLQTLVCTKPA